MTVASGAHVLARGCVWLSVHHRPLPSPPSTSAVREGHGWHAGRRRGWRPTSPPRRPEHPHSLAAGVRVCAPFPAALSGCLSPRPFGLQVSGLLQTSARGVTPEDVGVTACTPPVKAQGLRCGLGRGPPEHAGSHARRGQTRPLARWLISTVSSLAALGIS